MAAAPKPTWTETTEKARRQTHASGSGKALTAGPVAAPSPFIRSGDLLIREDAPLPRRFELASKPFLPGWQVIRQARPAELERTLSKEGWSLFCLARDIEESAIALDAERAMRETLQELCGEAEREGFNVIEVTGVTMRKFFGLRWVRLTAKLRHLQEGPYLFSTAERMEWELQRVRTAVPSIRMDGRRLGSQYRQYKGV